MNLEWAECMGFVCVFIFGPLFGAGWFCFLVQPTACVNFREIPCWETKMVAWQPHWQEMFLYIIDCIYICLLKEKAFSVILKGQYKLWSQILLPPLLPPPPSSSLSPLLPPLLPTLSTIAGRSLRTKLHFGCMCGIENFRQKAFVWSTEQWLFYSRSITSDFLCIWQKRYHFLPSSSWFPTLSKWRHQVLCM